MPCPDIQGDPDVGEVAHRWTGVRGLQTARPTHSRLPLVRWVCSCCDKAHEGRWETKEHDRFLACVAETPCWRFRARLLVLFSCLLSSCAVMSCSLQVLVCCSEVTVFLFGVASRHTGLTQCPTTYVTAGMSYEQHSVLPCTRTHTRTHTYTGLALME